MDTSRANLICTIVGHREIPKDDLPVKGLIERFIGKSLRHGDVWYSGAAQGIDKTLEIAYYREFTKLSNPKATAFLPWDGFNGTKEARDPLLYINVKALAGYKHARELAANLYQLYQPKSLNKDEKEKGIPTWTLDFMTRNIFEVCGEKFPALNSSADVLFCYAKPIMKGEHLVAGGTNLAVLLATMLEIPVYNLWYPDVRAAVEAYVDDRVDLLQMLSICNPSGTLDIRTNFPIDYFTAHWGLYLE